MSTSVRPADTHWAGRTHPAPRVSFDTKVMVNHKSEGLTLILAIIVTGLGHMYVGKLSQGAMLLVLQIILGVVMYFGFLLATTSVIGFILMGAVAIVSFVIWIYSIIDADKLAKQYNASLIETGNPPW